jgi:hypothetical protein
LDISKTQYASLVKAPKDAYMAVSDIWMHIYVFSLTQLKASWQR